MKKLAFPEGERVPRILIVDDNPAVVKSVRLSIESLGYFSSCCLDPTEALMHLKCGGYDVILTDYRMPRMTGIELAQEAKKFNARLPVILMTGYASYVNLDNMDAMGINLILEKPVAPAQLDQAIKDVTTN